MKKILIVEDERKSRQALAEILSQYDYDVLTASDGKSALSQINDKINAILLDLKLPDIDGMEILKKVRKKHPEIPVIIISAYGTINLAVEATKIGAYDFLEKPLSAERVMISIRNALEKQELEGIKDGLLKDNLNRYRMIGTSNVMRNVYEMIERVAPTSSGVLILGASGTGKELVANAIYNLSKRLGKPFIKLNCAAIPSELIESELFGHVKGAFTGAAESKPGLFEAAHTGTILLDEICEMSMPTQAKLLRTVEEKEATRIGDNEPYKFDVRILSATNADINERVENDKFRQDLLYRLNEVTIELPNLSERKEDIPALIEYQMKLFCEEENMLPKKILPEAIELLVGREWQGNVRELRNVIHKLMIFTDGDTIQIENVTAVLNLSDDNMSRDGTISLGSASAAFEKEFILNKLISNGWNVSKTAKVLCVDRTSLYRKMRRYGIEVP